MQEMKWNSAAEPGVRQRGGTVVETLAPISDPGESLAELAHDARNMVTALALYCDLLEEPGVLGAPFLHYGSELRLVASASRRLVEKIVLLGIREAEGQLRFQPERLSPGQLSAGVSGRSAPAIPAILTAAIQTGPSDRLTGNFICNLKEELIVNRSLLAAMAGSGITLTLAADGGALPARLNSEDLTRVLVNLVKNSAEAMRHGGHINISLREWRDPERTSLPRMLLLIEDDGSGIPAEMLETIFEPGFTTHAGAGSASGSEKGGWPAIHRGLGLSITRSIIEAAGGHIRAANAEGKGARFEIELPVLSR